jgi:hypothetical protein
MAKKQDARKAGNSKNGASASKNGASASKNGAAIAKSAADAAAFAAEYNAQLQREILPIPDISQPELTTYDAKDPDTKYPPIVPLRPPQGAPNVLLILVDDVGFGASSAFGGPCQTPNFERLAASGLKYNRFHTTALCSPTRSALLTGRNHHSVGMGNITEFATSAPGRRSAKAGSTTPCLWSSQPTRRAMSATTPARQ